MSNSEVFKSIKQALASKGPPSQHTAKICLQAIKYAEVLEGISGKEFCEGADLKKSYAMEFNMMRNIAPQLKKAGLDPSKL